MQDRPVIQDLFSCYRLIFFMTMMKGRMSDPVLMR